MSENAMPDFEVLEKEAIDLAPTKEEFYKGLMDENANLYRELEMKNTEIEEHNKYVLKKQLEWEKSEIKIQKIKEELKNKKSTLKRVESEYWKQVRENQKIIKQNNELAKQVNDYANRLDLQRNFISFLEESFDNEKDLLVTKYELKFEMFEALVAEVLGEDKTEELMKSVLF